MAEHVEENFSYRLPVSNGEVLTIDCAIDYLVVCRQLGVMMLKYFDMDESRPRTFFINQELFDFLTHEPVPETLSGGRLGVVERSFLFEHEYEAHIQTEMQQIEDWLE